jgi:hypothetical protein
MTMYCSPLLVMSMGALPPASAGVTAKERPTKQKIRFIMEERCRERISDVSGLFEAHEAL